MITPKGLLVTISKQTHSGKSGCSTDEAGVSRTPNVNTGDTYTTNDVEAFHVPYLSSLSPLSGVVDVS